MTPSCKDKDISIFYTPQEKGKRGYSPEEVSAKAICDTCPVNIQCRNNLKEKYGVWFGTTERERVRLRRRVRAGVPLSQALLEM